MKWYESGWTWLAAGLGAWLLTAKKAPAFVVTKVWKHEGCKPVTAEVKPYVDKFRRSANDAYGPSSTGEVCVEVLEGIPGLTLKERTQITLQILVPGVEDVTMDMDTIESRTQTELRDHLIGLKTT